MPAGQLASWQCGFFPFLFLWILSLIVAAISRTQNYFYCFSIFLFVNSLWHSVMHNHSFIIERSIFGSSLEQKNNNKEVGINGTIYFKNLGLNWQVTHDWHCVGIYVFNSGQKTSKENLVRREVVVDGWIKYFLNFTLY